MDGLLKRSRRRRRRGVRDLETFNGQLDQLEEKLFELGEAVGGLEEIVSASERPRSLPEACSVCTREPQGQQNASCADDPLSGCDPEKTCWACFEDWFQHRVLALARAERAFDGQYQTSSRGAATAARQLEPQLPDLSRMIRHYARPRERRPAAKRALGTRSGQDPGGGDDDPEGEPAGSSSRLAGALPKTTTRSTAALSALARGRPDATGKAPVLAVFAGPHARGSRHFRVRSSDRVVSGSDRSEACHARRELALYHAFEQIVGDVAGRPAPQHRPPGILAARAALDDPLAPSDRAQRPP